MKRLLSVVTLALVAAMFAFAQFGCAGPQPTTSTNVNLATPAPTPDKAAIETELTRIEKDWPRVLKDHDAEAIRRVEADDIVEIVPDGSTATKAQDIVDISAGNLTADSWDITETKVTVLDSDAAFVSGRSVIKGGKVKGPGGKTIDISGEYRFIDTFARRDGLWKLVASAAVKIQQPAGTTLSPSPSSSPATKASPAAKASPTAKPSPAMKASPLKAAPVMSPAKTKTP